MSVGNKIQALKFHRDVFEIAKFLMWDNEHGRDKAQQIINAIHGGKYGNKSGIWAQYGDLLQSLEDEIIEEIRK